MFSAVVFLICSKVFGFKRLEFSLSGVDNSKNLDFFTNLNDVYHIFGQKLT